MPANSLSDFLEELEQAGELARVGAEVDAELELAAIADQMAKQNGPALLFERVKGHHPPVVANLLASESRLCRALGVTTLDDLPQRLFGEPATAAGWFDRIKAGSLFSTPSKQATRTVRSGVCQQVVKLGRDVNLLEWPALRSWPLEQRRSITAGQTLTQHPSTGDRKLEATCLEIVDRSKLAIHWHRYHAGPQHLSLYAARGQRMPVAVWLGGDPAFSVAAAAPLPAEVDGYAFASLLCAKTIDLVKCRSHDLEVPAEAEIVIEGFIDPEEPLLAAGPIAQANGRYSIAGPAYPLSVTTITHRTNPVFSTTVPSGPPGETGAILRAIERLWLPVVKHAVPELVDYALAEQGGPYNLAILSIRKTYPGQARKVASAFWGLDAMMFVKMVVVVDAEIDIHQPTQVVLAALTSADPRRDFFFHDGPPHPWEQASGQALGIDATAKLPEEYAGPWPTRLAPSQETVDQVRARWSEYGLGPKSK